MGSCHKNIHLMLELFKASLMVLHFSFYTLMTFLMMLSAILFIYADDTTFYTKCDQVAGLWQHGG